MRRRDLCFALAVAAGGRSASAQNQQAQAATPRPRAAAPVISPEVQPDGHVTFRLQAPAAKEVTLRGEWVAAGGIDVSPPVAMTRDGAGVWSVTVGPLPTEVLAYSFTVDGLTIADPQNIAVKLAANGAAQSLVAIPGNPPRMHDIRDVPHGIVQENWYQSKAAGGQTRHFFVYTPPGYDPRLAAGYPVIVLLHGAGNSETNWESIGRANFILDNLIADKRALPMLLVMPFGHILPPGGDLRPNNALFEQDLLNDIVPALEARYNTAKGAKSRAIAGLSMGGMQALAMGLRHSDRFAWIGVFSPVTEPDIPRRYSEQLGKSEQLNGALSLLWVGCGTLDNLFQRTKGVDEVLSSSGVRHEFHAVEGARHSWVLWRENLAELAQRAFRAGTR
jgi:enterochelin esterase family protein